MIAQLALYFNSNMVRLKVNAYNTKSIHSINFNSNMVRLKEFTVGENTYLQQDFNSNMVRLKADIWGLLQFNDIISIPIWFD